MKKISKVSLFAFIGLFLIISMQSFAGKKPFQGIITYKISYPSSNMDASMMSMLPKVLTAYYGKSHVKTSITLEKGQLKPLLTLKTNQRLH